MPNPGERLSLNSANVTNFYCPQRSDACVVKLVSPAGNTAYARVNDQRMLALLATAAGTAKTVDVEYIQGKLVYDNNGMPVSPTVHLLASVFFTP